MTYEVETAVKYMKNGLGRALQIEENAWAMAWWWEASGRTVCWNAEGLKEGLKAQCVLLKAQPPALVPT